jgi:7-cyano-7-deazaguanine reductase
LLLCSRRRSLNIAPSLLPVKYRRDAVPRNRYLLIRRRLPDPRISMSRNMPHKPVHLGQPSRIPASPDDAVLDRVPNPHADTNYVARFTFPEFTTLCPVTGQPDFAIVVIDYVPSRFLIESKSLKLFLNSFRNHAAFHEECTVGIGKRLVDHLKPRWLRIGGYFHPRGGMPIDVFWQAGRLPRSVWVPDQGVRSYRGRE